MGTAHDVPTGKKKRHHGEATADTTHHSPEPPAHGEPSSRMQAAGHQLLKNPFKEVTRRGEACLALPHSRCHLPSHHKVEGRKKKNGQHQKPYHPQGCGQPQLADRLEAKGPQRDKAKGRDPSGGSDQAIYSSGSLPSDSTVRFSTLFERFELMEGKAGPLYDNTGIGQQRKDSFGQT